MTWDRWRGAPGSPPDLLDSVPKCVMPLNPHARMAGDPLSMPKQMPMVSRTAQMYPHPHPEMYPTHALPHRLPNIPQVPRTRTSPPSTFHSATQIRPYARDLYVGAQPSLHYLHRRRKEIMAQLEERKVISPPPFAPSPTLPRPFPTDYPHEYMEENMKAFGKCREPDYAGQYSPWSCDTIGSYMVTKDVKPKDVMAAGAMETSADGKGVREPAPERFPQVG
ncbi:hypothetical protein SKAU_G00117060 [Synaphobranchus kaupii]|uniref:Uncharacterized protein n=1 Tax=Synaphobranchus kaupii TaxID=118154 RepID=A0A9Q1FMU6_SYNKA|nr:hypothetical protein SKAU_G00117060 [Synaphobranchus kaupii]